MCAGCARWSTATPIPTPCPVPPDWSKEGYGSIFTAQKAEL
jgi:hypothetical protein